MSGYSVWKAILKPAEMQQIEVPDGAELLCAHEQYEQICVWFRCNPSAPKTMREVAIVGTGDSAPPVSEGRYLGSAFLQAGSLVFHVFERVSA